MKVCSGLLARVATGVAMLGVVVLITLLDPIDKLQRYKTRFDNGTAMFHTFQHPQYKLYQTVNIFNYTNTERYMQGLDDKLKVEEVGPFVYREVTEGLNMTVDEEGGVVKMTPKQRLLPVRELSVANPQDLHVMVPNLVMIVLGTLAADTLPSWSNTMVSWLMSSKGSKPFINVTAEEVMWGYKDPLVDIAGSYFPGWIDFSTVGIMKMFYDVKPRELELEMGGERKYAVRTLSGRPGLVEQGYEGEGTEDLCNNINGTYQGIMLTPEYPRDSDLRLFKYQGCRVYPFRFEREIADDRRVGVPYDRYVQRTDMYNVSGEYACKCTGSECPPDGLTSISKCFYGFPVYLSTPHFYGGDDSLFEYIEGLTPEEQRAKNFIDFERTTGVPVAIRSSMQTNLRVNVSPYNTAMKPFGKVQYLPVLWFNLNSPDGPSEEAIHQLRMRILYGPYVIMAVQLAFALCGFGLLLQAMWSARRGRGDRESRKSERDRRRKDMERRRDQRKKEEANVPLKEKINYYA